MEFNTNDKLSGQNMKTDNPQIIGDIIIKTEPSMVEENAEDDNYDRNKVWIKEEIPAEAMEGAESIENDITVDHEGDIQVDLVSSKDKKPRKKILTKIRLIGHIQIAYPGKIKQENQNQSESSKEEEVKAPPPVPVPIREMKRSELRHMINSKDSSKIKYWCKYCKYKPGGPEKLEKHVKKRHPNIYNCIECDFSTVNKISIKFHVMSKHTSERPFACEECDFRTVDKNRLKVHVRNKHTLESTLFCDHELCEFSTTSSYDLKRHISSHTKKYTRKCPYCDVQMSSVQGIRYHIMSRHTNEKFHNCSFCEESFVLKAKLEKHILKKHLKEKPISCHYEKCSYKCYDRSGLNSHIRAKHLKEKSKIKLSLSNVVDESVVNIKLDSGQAQCPIDTSKEPSIEYDMIIEEKTKPLMSIKIEENSGNVTENQIYNSEVEVNTIK